MQVVMLFGEVIPSKLGGGAESLAGLVLTLSGAAGLVLLARRRPDLVRMDTLQPFIILLGCIVFGILMVIDAIHR